MTRKLPTIKDLSALLKALKPTIGDEYRAEGCESDSYPSMTVTIGWDGESANFGWQTGDNSYTGGAYGYPHWAVIDLYRRANTRVMACDIRRQLDECVSWR